MSAQPPRNLTNDGGFVLTVPITLKRRNGRRVMAADTTPPRAATSLQRALARAHRWLRMLDAGEAASISELARQEGEDFSYIARMLNLTLLAPDIVAAILEETLPESARVQDLAINPPLLWEEQRMTLETRSRQP